MQDRELCGTTPALVRQDGSSAIPKQCVSPKLPYPCPMPSVTPDATEESRSASQWQESNGHFTSELREGGEQEGLVSDKKQGRFPQSATGCRADILNGHVVANTVPQRPFWGKVGLSRTQSSINLLDQDARAQLSTSGELQGKGLDGFGNHIACQQLETKQKNPARHSPLLAPAP